MQQRGAGLGERLGERVRDLVVSPTERAPRQRARQRPSWGSRPGHRRAAAAPEQVLLLADHARATVVEQQHLDRQLLLDSGGQLLDVHQERALAGHAHHGRYPARPPGRPARPAGRTPSCPARRRSASAAVRSKRRRPAAHISNTYYVEQQVELARIADMGGRAPALRAPAALADLRRAGHDGVRPAGRAGRPGGHARARPWCACPARARS